jgi:hypothetical protein
MKNIVLALGILLSLCLLHCANPGGRPAFEGDGETIEEASEQAPDGDEESALAEESDLQPEGDWEAAADEEPFY